MKRTNNARLGASFETNFLELSKLAGITTTRMPDGCRVVGRGRIVRVSTPFDWILSLDGKVALIDTKTTDATLFPPSKVSEHQVVELLNHQAQGILAGYVVEFRKEAEVVFVPARRLMQAFITRKGIASSDASCSVLGAPEDFNPRRIFRNKAILEAIAVARSQWELDP